MNQELLKLKLNTEHKNETGSRGFKKRYFFQNIDLIFELVEKNKVGYADIVEAMKKDGVVMTNQYFRRLMAAEKEKRVSSGKLPSKFVESKPTGKGSQVVPEPKETKTDSGFSPEKQAIKNELDRIENDDSLTLSQKREASTKAIASLVNKNPLANRK